MPSISAFYGIIIRMYFQDNDKHKMPHIHVYYAEDEAVFDLTGDIIAGEFPKKQAAYVKAWCLLHEEELSANWRLAVNGEEVYRIDLLR